MRFFTKGSKNTLISRRLLIAALCLLVTALLAVVLFVSGSVTAFAANGTAARDIMTDQEGKFYADYATSEDLREASLEVAEQLGEEGFVLMKNKNNMLPFSSDVKNISLFGKASVWPTFGGGGSGSGKSDDDNLNFYDSLHNAGFKTNSVLKAFYADHALSGPRATNNNANSSATAVPMGTEAAIDRYTESIQSTYSLYNDAALVVLARGGAEGSDVFRDPVASHNNQGMLTLTPSEKALIDHVTDNFDNVVVILNLSNQIDVDYIKENDKIGGLIWVGNPGERALNALGSILNGSVNPSGKLVHTYSSYDADPAWQNFGNNSQHDSSFYPFLYQGEVEGVKQYQQVNTSGMHHIEYEEGMYVDYRYFETAAFEASRNNYAGFVYDDEVQYTFGHGLSYTKFDWTASDWTSSMTKDGDISVKITVKNIGDVAGKDTVQLYYSAPYHYNTTPGTYAKGIANATMYGGIEKAHVSLGAFAKTKMLKPGDSQTLTLTLKVQHMASFDWNDANGNGLYGYELDPGDYTMYVGKDAHVWADTTAIQKTYTVAGTYGTAAGTWHYTEDAETGNDIDMLFSNGDSYDTLLKSSKRNMTFMSRGNFATTFATAPVRGTTSSNNTTNATNGAGGDMRTETADETMEFLNRTRHFTEADDHGTQTAPSYYAMKYHPSDAEYATTKWKNGGNAPWTVTAAQATAAGWEQYHIPGTGESNGPTTNNNLNFANGIDGAFTLQPDDPTRPDPTYTFADMSGWSFSDTRWDTVLNELTFQEIAWLSSQAWFSTAGIPYIGKMASSDNDGPMWIKITQGPFVSQNDKHDSTVFPCQPVVSATFNVELAELQGRIIGNEGLYKGMSSWMAPGFNLHRNRHGGRQFEYYSSDPLLSGEIGGSVALGVQSKGITVMAKHFALNEQDTSRSGLRLSVTEQAARELYLRSFELAIKKAGIGALMTYYGALGNVSNMHNYAVLTSLVREQWGFEGMIGTDYGPCALTNISSNPLLRIRAGNGQSGTSPDMYGYYNPTENKVYMPDTRNYDSTNRQNTAFASLKATGAPEAWPMKESPAHWAALRKSAKEILFMTANNSNTKNHLRLDDFTEIELWTGASNVVGHGSNRVVNVPYFHESNYNTGSVINEIEMTLGTALTNTNAVSIGVDTDTTSDTYFGTQNVSYTLKNGELPEGVTLNTATGALTGTPTGAAGTYQVMIELRADFWIYRGGVFNIEVVSPFTLSEDTATVGTEYTGTIEGDFENKIYSVLSGQLPAGLELNSTGQISGIPTVSGDYDFVVRVTIGNSSYDTSFTISVVATSYTVTYNTNGGNSIANDTVAYGGNALNYLPVRAGYVFTGWYTDAALTSAYNFNAPVTTNTTLYAGWVEISSGMTAEEVQAMIDADKQTDETGGCGSTIALGSAFAGITIILAGVAVLLVRKTKKQK